MLDTKDPAGFLQPFAGLDAAMTAVPLNDSPNFIPPARLETVGRAAGLEVATRETVDAALDRAVADGAKRVLLCGSLYLAGEVLRQGND